MTPALLALADGRVFRGEACGAPGEAHGEVVFNTSMTGYQEILTDPSYRGQIVCMTYPLIGNYGVNPEDVESRQPWVNGLIVKEACPYPSSWRGRQPLAHYMREHDLVGVQGIDTRALTRHLRDHGAQEGIISPVELDPDRLAIRNVGRHLVGIERGHAGHLVDASGAATPEPEVARDSRPEAHIRNDVALSIEYAEMVAPVGDATFFSEADRLAVVTLQRWSLSPQLEATDNVVMLLTETASEILAP